MPSGWAQLLGVDLINLGFGGGACLEPEIADYIAGRQDWDFASLELGINLLRQVEPEEFARRVDYFVERIEHMVDGMLTSTMYPRLTLAPGARFASQGCYILRFDESEPARLVVASDWIVP